MWFSEDMRSGIINTDKLVLIEIIKREGAFQLVGSLPLLDGDELYQVLISEYCTRPEAEAALQEIKEGA